MREAIEYISVWAAEQMEIENILAETQCANVGSIKLLEKSGFEFVRQIVRFGQPQAIYQLNLLDVGDKKN